MDDGTMFNPREGKRKFQDVSISTTYIDIHYKNKKSLVVAVKTKLNKFMSPFCVLMRSGGFFIKL